MLLRLPPILLLLVALLAGCARSGPEGSPSVPLRRVVLQSDWFPQAEHGGFYQAVARGFYAEAGLDVVILPGGPGAGIKLKLARGEADFAMMKSDDAIVAAARGLPFVMVMAVLQHDPQALIVHADSPVRTWKDLDGRTVIASASMTWIPYLQRRYGITFNLRPNTYGLGEFLANREAVQQGLATHEPFFAAQHGRPVRALMLADSGYDCSPAVVARSELIRTDPGVVRAFVAASIRGWIDYIGGDPSPAERLILARNPEMTAELLAFSRGEMIRRRLVSGDPEQGERVGHLSLPRLATLMETLASLKVIDAPLPVAKVATDQFIPSSR